MFPTTAAPTTVDFPQWTEIAEKLKISQWSKCRKAAADPCSCSGVFCNEDGLITKLNLRNFDLRGEFPVDALNALFEMEDSVFEGFNMIQNPRVSGPCAMMPVCNEEGALCRLPNNVKLCETPAPTAPTTLTPTPAPTTAAPTPESRPAWTGFFEAMGGNKWSVCKGKVDDPCSCKATQPARFVACNEDGNIGQIKLPGVNLKGDFSAAVDFLTTMKEFGLIKLDLSKNKGIDFSVCVPDELCADIECVLPGSAFMCSSTDVPTTATPTETPTVSPTMFPTTAAPTTATTAGWQALYDATRGSKWTKCKGSREDPCKCSLVTCDENGEITEINLKKNNLKVCVLCVWSVLECVLDIYLFRTFKNLHTKRPKTKLSFIDDGIPLRGRDRVSIPRTHQDRLLWQQVVGIHRMCARFHGLLQRRRGVRNPLQNLGVPRHGRAYHLPHHVAHHQDAHYGSYPYYRGTHPVPRQGHHGYVGHVLRLHQWPQLEEVCWSTVQRMQV